MFISLTRLSVSIMSMLSLRVYYDLYGLNEPSSIILHGARTGQLSSRERRDVNGRNE